MKGLRLLLLLLFTLWFNPSRANHTQHFTNISIIDLSHEYHLDLSELNRPGPLWRIHSFKNRTKHLNRKLTAAALAFPFPFGIVGLHRIYLGCAPYIPVVYIASLGGVFGILPLIDCIVLLTEKDVSKYANSGQVFMWVD